MSKYFLEQMNNCVNEFYKIYNIDEYISKNKYEKFIDRYKDVFDLLNKYENKNENVYQKMITIAQNGYNLIEKKNKLFLQKHLKVDKEYFDHIFSKIDPNIKLDEEQRKAILIDEDYSLIIAGAGSGKTTTMAAKVKYLIEKKKVNPKDIILLAFTNRATEELNHLLNEQFFLNIEVLTFHKLGNKFIRNILNAKPEIISDAGIYKVLSQYFIDNVFKNKDKLKQYMECFSEFILLNNNAFDFNNYEDYYRNYTNLKYEECKNFLDKEIKRRIVNRMKHYKTINGDYVKSEAEVKIANYLYKNGISYKYEDLYPYKLANGRIYKPDFTIDNFDEKIYVEYYGLTKLNEDNSIISDTNEYQNTIFLKRKTHLKYATNYIELFGRYENGDNYLPKLSYKLSKYNIIKTPKSNKEIFYRLMETSKDSTYFKLINFISSFIGLFKELNYNINDFENFINSTQDEKMKKQLILLKDAFNYYQNTIHTIIDGKVKIDFQDMIHYAYSRMEKLKETEKFQYKYVIIDEYQDISVQRCNFAKKISELFNSKIVAVGDDWQTIYSFSGSDINLFTKFYETMGYAEITTITNTYRNSQELIDVAGEFVLKNSFQLNKKLHSEKHLNNPIELVKYDYNYDYDNLPESLNTLIDYLYNNNPNDKILLLGRFNSELDNLLNSKYFYKKTNLDDRIYCKKHSDMKIDFLSIHKSKGVGYDQVIILNGLNICKGFPSQIKDHPVIKLIKGTSANVEENYIEYPEERRLFYVALTRTKNKVYILIPNSYEMRSDFVKEIEDQKNVIVSNII